MSTNTAHPLPTLVVGGTGKTGRRVVSRLLSLGVPTRIASRSTGPGFDWTRPDSWPVAIEGMRAAYVTYYPDLAAPGAAETVAKFTEAATAAGVERLVLLSGRGEPDAEEAERAVQAVAPHATIVRSTWFAQNFSEDYMAEHVRSGVVALPAGHTPEPFVDVEDIADVVVAALTGHRHVGRLYELTGPRLLTFGEAVAEIAAATGRNVRYEPVSIEEHERTALSAGVPAEAVAMLTYLFSEVLDGRNAHLADGVHRALGRAPTDFADFARRTADDGAWDVNSESKAAATATPLTRMGN